MGRRRSPQYPCGVCNANCNPEDWSVFCDSCQSWFHDHCENLSASQMNELAGSDEDFLCTSCTHVDGRFDFTASISRLGKAADCGIAKLRAAIQAESTFLRRFESNFPTSAVNLESRKIDEVASKYLQKMTGSRVMQPCAVSADGNCLFNALSVAVTGDEAATSQIRVLTAIEMMTFGQEYVPQLTSRDIHLVSPDYEEACLACAKSGSYSSAWTIQAAASVLKRDIMSTYPPVNGLFDVVCKILDTIFRPRSPARPKLAPVHIMWTNVMPERSTGTWTPNHFVPLLPSTFPDVVDLDKPTELSSPHSSIPDTPSFSPIDEASDPVFTYDRSEVTDCNEEVPLSSTPVHKSKKRRLSPSTSSDTPDPQNALPSSTSSDTPDPQNALPSSTSSDTPDPQNALPSKGKFLTTAQLLDIVNSDSVVYDSVPIGRKDNVFFVLASGANYCDDCGVWDSKKGSTVNSYVIVDSAGIPKTVYLKDKLWCTESRPNGKKVWIPLVPQPAEGSVIKLHRYYATLKCHEQYKKRCTSVISSCVPARIIVEYCGVRPETVSVHGNAKDQKAYVRTDPKVLKKIGEAVTMKPPRQVYQDMAEDNSFEAPCNFKQIRDKKYCDEKKNRKQHRNNLADEVLCVIGLLEQNPCVRKIIMDKGKVPSVILYSDHQLEDLKRNIAGGSVLGVDRTFNLGACFVTTTVYKNLSVTHRESGKSPLFFGPMYLHWDGEFETYHSFFSHLQAKLYDSDVSNVELKIGSDQEYALVKAIKCCFPQANHILCSKHLKENVTRYLCDKVGCSTKARCNIVNMIFGDNGLLHSKDRFTFENKCISMLPYLEEYPQFHAYFDKLKPLLFSNVCEPNQKDNFEKLWTNNNCESLNNILKLTVNWKPQKLPDLVEKLVKVTKLQMLDLRRSLYGNGNYVLIPKLSKYIVSREKWVKKSEEEKEGLLFDFLRRKKCVNTDRIHATNVKFSVPYTQRIAKKPCQRKRSRSERAK